jgi:ribonuclease HI
MPVLNCDVEQAREQLAAAGIEVTAGNTDHERWRASYEGATAIAYDDKVVLQGSDPGRLEALLSEGGGRARVYFDGACRGNPGEAAVGYVIVTDGGIVTEGGERVGRMTNNAAEYEALLKALELAAEYGFDDVEIRGDSELIVKQVTGEYDTNDPDLREYRVQVRELLTEFSEWSISHVPRDINERADKLANEAFEDG